MVRESVSCIFLYESLSCRCTACPERALSYMCRRGESQVYRQYPSMEKRKSLSFNVVPIKPPSASKYSRLLASATLAASMESNARRVVRLGKRSPYFSLRMEIPFLRGIVDMLHIVGRYGRFQHQALLFFLISLGGIELEDTRHLDFPEPDKIFIDYLPEKGKVLNGSSKVSTRLMAVSMSIACSIALSL